MLATLVAEDTVDDSDITRMLYNPYFLIVHMVVNPQVGMESLDQQRIFHNYYYPILRLILDCHMSMCSDHRDPDSSDSTRGALHNHIVAIRPLSYYMVKLASEIPVIKSVLCLRAKGAQAHEPSTGGCFPHRDMVRVGTPCPQPSCTVTVRNEDSRWLQQTLRGTKAASETRDAR